MLKIKDLMLVSGYGATTCRGLLHKMKELNNRKHTELCISINDAADYFGLSVDFIQKKCKL